MLYINNPNHRYHKAQTGGHVIGITMSSDMVLKKIYAYELKS